MGSLSAKSFKGRRLTRPDLGGGRDGQGPGKGVEESAAAAIP